MTAFKSGACAFALVTALLASACGKQERGADQWPISKNELKGMQPEAAGEASYRRYCLPCHGSDGRGNGGVTGANFVGDKERLSAKSDAELEAAVRDGKRGERAVMPAHKPVLTDAQIHDVVSYVRRQFFAQTSTTP